MLNLDTHVFLYAVTARSARRGDPADALIAATSLVQKAPLVTRDRALRRSKIVPIAR